MSRLAVSVIVYTLAALIMCAMGCLAFRRERAIRLRGHNDSAVSGLFGWEIVLSVLFFAALAGARYHTGYDHQMYLEQYRLAMDGNEFTRDNFEPLFRWITKGFASLRLHFFFYFAFWGLLQIGLIYYALRERKHLLPWLGVVIMLGGWFVPMMNSMRQVVAECIFLALTPAIIRREPVVYFSGIVVAALLHRSAWLLLPFYWLPCIKFERFLTRRKLLLVIFFSFILLGVYPVWMKLFSWLPDFLNSVGLEHYEGPTRKIVSGNFRWQNFGPLRVSTIAINVLIVWLYPLIKKEFDDDKLLPLFFLFSFLGICFENLFCNTSHFILRPFEYFKFFCFVMQCYLLSYLWKSKRWLMLSLSLFLICARVYWTLYKSQMWPTESNWQEFYNFFFYYPPC